MAKSEDIRLIGGVGTIWGRQFRQQNRVYSSKGVSTSMSAAAINGLYIRRWKTRKA